MYAFAPRLAQPLASSHLAQLPGAPTGFPVVDGGLGGLPRRLPARGGNQVLKYADANGSWIAHVFTSSGDFTVTQRIEVEYLVVAGGGGGGTANLLGGGGGAGGYLKFIDGETGNTGSAAIALSPNPYVIIVGAGGIASGGDNINGNEGTNSVALGLTALGGGGGGGGGTAGNGGSGGGSRGGVTGDSANTQVGTGTSPQGFAGGNGWSSTTTNNRGGGGGGGASEVGGNFQPAVSPGDGGDGIATSITGALTYYAGGGGGAVRDPAGTPATGGLGGGGNGGVGNPSVGVTAGAVNRGGGGGGSIVASSGQGGSGIVVLRYRA